MNKSKKSITKGKSETHPYVEFGHLLRNLRLSKGMSQSDLAEKLDLHPSYLSRIEMGERRPSPRILKLMSQILGVKLNRLLAAVGLIDEEIPVSAAAPAPARAPAAAKGGDSEKYPYVEFGRLLRNLRLSRGMSQSDLAEKLGLHPSYLSRIEQGERRPSPRILKLMARVLEVTLDHLLAAVGLTDEEIPVSAAAPAPTRAPAPAKVGESEKYPYVEFGHLLRNLRLSRGMSQSDLAEKLNLHPSYLSRIEQGERRPSPRILKLMAQILGVTLNELLTAVGLIDAEVALPTVAPAPAPRPASAPAPVSAPAAPAAPEPSTVMQEIEQIKRRLAQLTAPTAGMPAPRKPAPDVRTIPVFDQVPAGVALPEAKGTYRAMPELTLTEDELRHDSQAFALVATGDSMTDLGILEGDIVVVSPSSRIEDGDTVVAILGERDISLKIAYFEGRKVLLHAGNPNYRPILLRHPEEVEILGKVILVRRSLG